MRSRGEQTRYPGVQRINDTTCRVRIKLQDPRTGKPTEVDRLVDAKSVREAAARRSLLMDEKRAETDEKKRVRVTDFAQSWIESKAVILDDVTCDAYTEALEKHVLPALGKFYYDALKPSDVQSWVNRSLQRKG